MKPKRKPVAISCATDKELAAILASKRYTDFYRQIAIQEAKERKSWFKISKEVRT